MSPRWPTIYGYRGAVEVLPPNTLPALQQILSDGADGVAIDVEVTRDGVLVAAEDRLIRTLGLGPRRVRDVAWSFLAGVDAGRAFTRRLDPVSVSPLRKLLSELGTRTRVALLLPYDGDARVEAALSRLRVVRVDTCVIARDPQLLRAAEVGIPGAVLLRQCGGSGSRGNADGVAMSVSAYREPNARPSGLRFGLGCDTATAAVLALEAGLDAVLTERPAWLRDRLRTARRKVEASAPVGTPATDP